MISVMEFAGINFGRILIPRFKLICRITISQNLYFAGLNYTSPTLAGALTNGVPAMTFVMAIMFRYSELSEFSGTTINDLV